MQLLWNSGKVIFSIAASFMPYETDDLLTLQQAIQQVNNAFATAVIYHGPRIRVALDKFQEQVKYDVNTIIYNTDRISQEKLNSMIKKGIECARFGKDCAFNELSDSLGTLSVAHVRNSVFYAESESQTGGWECGYHAVLAAFKLNHLIQNRIPITTESLRQISVSYLPEQSVLRREMAQQIANCSMRIAAKEVRPIDVQIQACVTHLKNTYQQPAFNPDKNPCPEIRDFADNYHLRDLAKIMGLSRFQTISGNPAVFTLPDSTRAYDSLLRCAGNPEEIRAWIDNYKAVLDQEIQGLRVKYSAAEESELNEFITQSYKKVECLLGANWLRPLEKLERILTFEQEETGKKIERLRTCWTEAELEEWIKANADPTWNQKFLEVQLREEFRRNCIEPNEPGALHFACLLSKGQPFEHWFSISVVKEIDLAPIMILQDSCKVDMRKSRDARRFVSYIHDTFLKPFAPVV